jgi:hypothetical protein
LGLINYVVGTSAFSHPAPTLIHSSASDAYLAIAASALAAVTVLRSLAGAGFPLFATQMYDKLNPRWASTLLGFIALLLAPIPVVLIRYVLWDVFGNETDVFMLAQIWTIFEEKIKICTELGER